jgi:hypothetical protein
VIIRAIAVIKENKERNAVNFYAGGLAEIAERVTAVARDQRCHISNVSMTVSKRPAVGSREAYVRTRHGRTRKINDRVRREVQAIGRAMPKQQRPGYNA